MKVFLGGTCAGSKWREKLIPLLKCEYFNPVVKEWNENCIEIEEQEKIICDYHLYVITPKISGWYSIAEVTHDVMNKMGDKCIFCVTREDDDREWVSSETKSLNAVKKLIKESGGTVVDTLDEVADFLNECVNQPNNNMCDVEIKFKKLHTDAVIPSYAHNGDVGMDITSTWLEYDAKLDVYIYHTGLAVESDFGYGMFLFPRSSNSKTEAYLTNSVGIVDSAIYRGEIQFRYKNRHPYKKSLLEKIFRYVCIKRAHKFAPYKEGERIGQMVILPYPKVKITEVDSLSDSERGTGGFGSTGK